MGRKNYATLSDIEKYINWVDALRNASKKNVIVCQNKRDAAVMEAFGCKNVIWPIMKEQDFVQHIINTEKPVILLYDTDRNSNEKHERIRTILQQNGIKVNSRFRKLLFTAKSRTVSGILNLLNRLAGSFDRIRPILPD